MDRRDHLLTRILAERVRQGDLPGLEADMRNTPNDWAAIATSYLGEVVRRGGVQPSREDFEDSMVKAAAVILAALEHADAMIGHFSP